MPCLAFSSRNIINNFDENDENSEYPCNSLLAIRWDLQLTLNYVQPYCRSPAHD